MQSSPKTEAACVGMYLAAIVVANFAVARFGQIALPFTAFCLIPFDLVTRDVLHDRWRRHGDRWLWACMFALIASGSILSAALAWEVRRVALASFIAFGASGLTNAGVYHLMRDRGRYVRMNVSNAFAAVVDSLVFPLVAFGGLDWRLSAAQTASKFVGGLVLSYLFLRILK